MITYSPQLQAFTSTLLSKNSAHGFGTKMSGNGRDPKEIQKYLRSHNISFTALVDPDQRHTANISVISSTPADELIFPENVDGLITNQKNVALTIITADCAPILYQDRKKGLIGISHNGRKGTELMLTSKMIREFKKLDSVLSDIRVAIGPCVGYCSYPVNLIEENVKQLRSEGINKEQIDFFPFCTECDEERFFSYRRTRDIPDFPEQFSFIVQ